MDSTTNQVKPVPNPTGKGGFGDNPQNRSDGRWGKENSFSYWMNYFKNLPKTEFLKWREDNPEDTRTMAADLAYERVLRSRKDIVEFKEVADRTEGRAKQVIEHEGEFVEKVEVSIIRNESQTKSD